eukprot:COSAG02_NODE_1689_length_11307_cov_50.624911_13_plen_113_part_00
MATGHSQRRREEHNGHNHLAFCPEAQAGVEKKHKGELYLRKRTHKTEIIYLTQLQMFPSPINYTPIPRTNNQWRLALLRLLRRSSGQACPDSKVCIRTVGLSCSGRRTEHCA